MPNPSITSTSAEINLKLNTITRKQDDEIKKAVQALTPLPPSVTINTPPQNGPKIVTVQNSSALPKG